MRNVLFLQTYFTEAITLVTHQIFNYCPKTPLVKTAVPQHYPVITITLYNTWKHFNHWFSAAAYIHQINILYLDYTEILYSTVQGMDLARGRSYMKGAVVYMLMHLHDVCKK